MGRLPADARLGAIRLRAGDVGRLRDFYETTIGLEALDGGGDVVSLGVDGSPLVELVPGPDAPSRPPRSTGLFHLALLVPTRADLARTLRRVAGSGWPLSGASDHLVSEALYLSDPEGNGIELYRDRPRDDWPIAGDSVEMATLPLDLENLLGEAGGETAAVSMPEPGRSSATSTSRSPTSTRPRRSGSTRSVSTSPLAATRARCSPRRAATTTTSG